MRAVLLGDAQTEAELVRRSALVAVLVQEAVVAEIEPGLLDIEVVSWLRAARDDAPAPEPERQTTRGTA
jgi:hypothetical protein